VPSAACLAARSAAWSARSEAWSAPSPAAEAIRPARAGPHSLRPSRKAPRTEPRMPPKRMPPRRRRLRPAPRAADQPPCSPTPAAVLTRSGAPHLTAEQIVANSDANIERIKRELNLTPEQEKHWSAFNSAMHYLGHNGAERLNLRIARAQRDPPDDIIEQMRNEAQFLNDRALDQRNVADAAPPLFASLDGKQKQTLIHKIVPLSHQRGLDCPPPSARKIGCAAAANSRAPMPWGRLRGAAPDYPAAAARPPESASNHDQTLTDCGRTDGQLAVFWGTCVSLCKCCTRASPNAHLAGTRPAKLVSNTRRDEDIFEQASA